MDLSEVLKESGVSVGTLLKNSIRLSIEGARVDSSFDSATIEKRFNSTFAYLSTTPQISSDDASDLVSKACVTCLMKLSPREQADKLVIQCISKILVLLLQKGSLQTRLDIFSQLLILSKATDIKIQGPLSGEKQNRGTMVDIRVLVYLLSLVFVQIEVNVMSENDKEVHGIHSQLFQCLLSFLQHADKTLCHQLCSNVLPYFIVGTAEGFGRLTSLWNLVMDACQNNINIEMNVLDLALTVLCCFVDQFLGSSHDNKISLLLDLKTSSFFWSIIQDGLGHSDPLNRKRSSFLLQRSLKSVFSKGMLYHSDLTTSDHVFWRKKQHEIELKTIWEATVLLLETLEEKQVHIVKPVMPRLKVLIDATQTFVEDYRLLHFSWLCVIVKRAFVHESKTIIKWAVNDFLTMPMDKSPLRQQEFWPFLFNDLLSILNDSFLYTREQEAALGSCSPISSSFVEFTISLVQSISDDSKNEFLVRFMEAVTEHKMADVPLVFITYALSKIPSQPVVAGKFLAVVRELVLTCLDTHSIPMRAAIQCFLLTTIIHLSKEKELTYHDITTTLGAFKANECLSFDSVAWKQASGWLIRVTKHINDSIVELLRNTIKGVINNTTDDNFRVSHVARLLLLFIYSVSQDDNFFNFISEKEVTTTKELVGGLISPVLDVIVKAHTHPYLSKTAINNALELLVLMLKELPATTTPLGSLFYHTIEPWIQDILHYVQRELLIGSSFPPLPDLAYLSFFLDAWDTLWLLLEVNCSPIKNSVFTEMESQCCAELDKAAGTKELFLVSCLHGAMGLASWLCKKKKNASSNDPLLCCISQLVLEVELLKPSIEQKQSGDGFEDGWERKMEEMNKEWGPIVSHYLKCHWECVLYYKSLTIPLNYSSTNTSSSVTLRCIDAVQLAKACTGSLDAGGNNAIVTVCKCMTLLVPELYQVSRDDLYNHISVLWKLTLGFKNKRKIFSDALNAFLSFAFHPVLLIVHSSSDERLYEILQQVLLEFQEIGEQKTGMFNVLVSHCCWTWLKAVDDYSTSLQTSLICYSDFIKDTLLFGPVYKRNLRVPHDVNCFIEALGDECSSNSLHLRPIEGDAHVRLMMTLFLVQLADKSRHDSRLSWVTQVFIPHLIRQLLQKSHEEISGRPKCFINSLSHRIRSRLWQAIVILLPYMEQPTLKDALPAVFKATESGDQFSVRYLQEWAASYTIAVHPNLLPMLWEHLENSTPNKFCLLVSVLTITAQVGRCLDSNHGKYDFLVKALPLVMKWTNCHHFMTKMYAQSVLLYLWDLYVACGTTDQQLDYLHPIVEFIKLNGDMSRCRKRMCDNLFYTLCHAVKDLSFEAVYYIIPQSSQLTDDELISKNDFEHSEFWNDSLFIPLECDNQQLCEAAAKVEEGRQSKDSKDKNNLGMSDDVQKKITPWSNSSDTIMNELFPDQSDYPVASYRKPTGGELILVASLLHKPPNLGGLCRTCEIFGVSQLVLNSMNITEDSQFQALSVSAEKWVPITQVRASNLEDYLRNIKQQGYSLVGVEQTTQSKCLTSYTFPLKTVLLLGNEREGIPVHLIHMLDECVEIPQLGIIRSLNVHISGALLIWEYTKQHGFKTAEDT